MARARSRKALSVCKSPTNSGSIYTDDQFSALFPRRGKHAEAPGRLALATVLLRNSWRACPIDRLRMPCADGSTSEIRIGFVVDRSRLLTTRS